MRYTLLGKTWVLFCLLCSPALGLAGEDTASSHVAAGRRLVASGRWDKAAVELERALALDPRNTDAHTYLCRVYLGKGQTALAVSEGLRAIAAGHTPRGRAYLAMAYVETGNLNSAENYAQTAILLSPGLGVAYAAQALVYLARGEHEKALDSAKQGIATRDRDPDVPLVYARIHLANDDTDEALYWLGEAARYQPNSVVAQSEMGRVLEKKGNHRAAVDAYARALRLEPEDTRVRCAYAEALSAAGDTQAALTEARRAIKAAPDLPAAHRAMAVALAASGECEAAEQQMESALAAGATSADSYRRLAEIERHIGKEYEALRSEGEACAIEGKRSEAIEKFAAAQALRPDSTRARMRLAEAYLDGDRYEEAAGEYSKILAAPDLNDSTKVQALVGLGRVAYTKRSISEAVGWYKKALALNPKDATAWEGLGRTYDYQWRTMSRSVVRVGVRLTSPTESFAQDLDSPDGPVRVEGEIFWTQRGVGSGFVVNQRGDIVTNAHVVEILRPSDWEYELSVGVRERAGGKVRNYYEGEVIAYDVDLDLAVVRANGATAMPAPIPIGSATSLSVGQWVFELGHPLGGDYDTNGGSVLDLTSRGVEYDAEFQAAMSGGPLVDERGIIVGVVCMGSPTKTNGLQRQLAVSAETLKKFLDDHDIPYIEAPQ